MKTCAPLTAIDLAEALHLGHAVAALQELGVFELLAVPRSKEFLARKLCLSTKILQGILEFVAARTSLIKKCDQRYIKTKAYTVHTRHVIGLYLGSFRENATQVKSLLKKRASSRLLVDRKKHAAAFAEAVDFSSLELSDLLLKLDLNFVVDIGCGSAAMLRQLASSNPDFVGWGIDMNPFMCSLAEKVIKTAHMENRIKIFQGDSRKLLKCLPANAQMKIQAIVASQIANELFGSPKSFVQWLGTLKSALPNRLLIIADYYGRLGTGLPCHSRETLLHDYVQIISEQGVPPSNLASWQAHYAKAGVNLLHVVEDTGTTRFFHILRL